MFLTFSFRFTHNYCLHSLESARLFSERGIPTRVILDAAVGAFMEEVDLCLVGAEGVMENGGIVNKVSELSMRVASGHQHSRACLFISYFTIFGDTYAK